MQTSKEFLRIFLDMGEALLSSGAEIFRVEDTLNRMGYACGATQMNVFVITSSIVITMEFPGEGARTQTRRIRESYGLVGRCRVHSILKIFFIRKGRWKL